LQACTDDTRTTAVAKEQAIFAKKHTLQDLLQIVNQQSDHLVGCEDFYPKLDLAFSPLTKEQMEMPRDKIQKYIQLIHLPCFVIEDSFEKYKKADLFSHFSHGQRKQKRTARVIAQRRIEGQRAPPKVIQTSPLRKRILHAKNSAEKLPSEATMSQGDYLIMPGGLVH
jgi:hypothetical protein